MPANAAREQALSELIEMIEQTKTLLVIERNRSRTAQRRWATLVFLLLFLGAVIFGALAARQEIILNDLRATAKRSCELRNANEALLKDTWSDLHREFARSDPLVAKIYEDAVAGMQARDCSIYVR